MSDINTTLNDDGTYGFEPSKFLFRDILIQEGLSLTNNHEGKYYNDATIIVTLPGKEGQSLTEAEKNELKDRIFKAQTIYNEIKSRIHKYENSEFSIYSEYDVQMAKEMLKDGEYRLDDTGSRDSYIIMPRDTVVSYRDMWTYVYGGLDRKSYVDGEENEQACRDLIDKILTSDFLGNIEAKKNEVIEEINKCKEQREKFEEAGISFPADQKTLMNILSNIDGLNLCHTGRSGFESRNAYIGHVFTPQNPARPTDIEIEKEKEIADLCMDWAQKQKEQTYISRFKQAAEVNKRGFISIISEGGVNPKMIPPDNYVLILQVRTQNTQDYRQNMSHTYDNLYVNKDELRPDKNGVLHLDIPKDYMGMFIGKGGTHIKEITKKLCEFNPEISKIKTHEFDFERKKVVFTEITIPTITIDELKERKAKEDKTINIAELKQRTAEANSRLNKLDGIGNGLRDNSHADIGKNADKSVNDPKQSR